jgi:hypothetical protein
MFNIVDNTLRSIKHIQKKFFGGVDGIMTCDFLLNTPCERQLDAAKYQR